MGSIKTIEYDSGVTLERTTRAGGMIDLESWDLTDREVLLLYRKLTKILIRRARK